MTPMGTLDHETQHKALDFADLPVGELCRTDRLLLPVEAQGPFLGSLSQKELHAFSWALGLLAASSIKEHEKILNVLRPLAAPGNDPETLSFFLEEAVHAGAFENFLHAAARTLNLTPEELSSFLPTYKRDSFCARAYALEARLGGHAIWWAVAATEEESIRLFQSMKKHHAEIDSPFFELNRLHFLEESRHSSFSYRMMAGRRNPLSYSVSRILQTIWLFRELSSFRRVKRFRQRHWLLEDMAQLSERFDALSFKERLRIILKDLSYTRMMTRPHEHPRIRSALKKNHALVLKLPEVL